MKPHSMRVRQTAMDWLPDVTLLSLVLFLILIAQKG